MEEGCDGGTFFEVVTENDHLSTTGSALDRRGRKRAARRAALLDAAANIVREHGLDALTMTALGETADYATASLYTYFPSRSALVAALQQWALERLAAACALAEAVWLDPDPQTHLAGNPIGEQAIAVARVVAFGELILAAPRWFPLEFGLQQRLLATPGLERIDDAATVVPVAWDLLSQPARLLTAAGVSGALVVGDPFARTVTWLLALHGVLAADQLVTGMPYLGTELGRQLTVDLLIGWGVDASTIAVASELAASWWPRTHQAVVAHTEGDA